MDTKAQTFLKIFEKLGTPLIAAVNEISVREAATAAQNGQAPAADTPKKDAEAMAQLLTVLTRASIEMADKADIQSSDADKDDLRLATASALAPLIASLYQLTGKIPTDQDIARIADVFQAMGSYTDNYISVREAAARLERVEKGLAPLDDNQIRLQTLNALMPVMNSVIAFPFGETPQKLLRKIIDRLLDEARALAEETVQATDPQEKKMAELALLRGIVVIYSQAHFGEMARIMGLDNQQRESMSLSLDPVWKAFDERLEMLKVMAQVLNGDEGVPASAASGSKSPAVNQSEAKTPEIFTAPQPATPEQTSPPPVPQAPAAPEETKPSAPAAPPAGDNENPMSFFAKSGG